jgi:hypothetical protein
VHHLIHHHAKTEHVSLHKAARIAAVWIYRW